MALERGTRLGSYEIVEPLGTGAMGEVYRVRDLKLNRDVAIKVLASEAATDPETSSTLAGATLFFRTALLRGRRVPRPDEVP